MEHVSIIGVAFIWINISRLFCDLILIGTKNGGFNICFKNKMVVLIKGHKFKLIL